jgi:hypothetical protein
VVRGFGDGARLMRASFELVRRHPALIWFPVISTCCLVLSAGFWIFEGAWLYAVNATWFFYVPLVAIGMYSLFFVGIFFNVALAGAAAQVIDGEDATLRDGLDVAWSRLGGIAGWAGYSLFVALLISLLKSKALRWLGTAAEITQSCSSAGTSIRSARRRCSALSCSAGSPCRRLPAWSGRCSPSSFTAFRPAEARKSRWRFQPREVQQQSSGSEARLLPSLDVRGAQFGRVGDHVDLGDSAAGDRETDHRKRPFARHDDDARGPVHDRGARMGGKPASAL